ncbi:NifB/NifX family molybdenum-iron cluster-binding protein [Vibrio sp. 99-8-1]|uniref:NifB/NifX family molybdenum-iron cluster-binding protein n=1 Tax=Vibrio sp. 99-8-1 TaxID=2607602 RepID=UPI0014936915|nr:NifB/NifX family molybdenum-iron cluster-binding protein [Vibrio sp. 99-8-1]NOI67183.1 dinitrogenase iron-molybdenum cofactor [Vibrio sp. 99-8-1]
MIYAIPHNRNCVANHFMKASQFAFINQENSSIDYMHNPAALGNSSCQDKKSLLSLISSMKADAVIVRNIGERALGKLLSSGIRVFQVTAQTPLASAINSPMTELTSAEQGRPSTNHAKKGGCSHKGSGSGCGCGSSNAHEHKQDGVHLQQGAGKGQMMRRNLRSISSIKPFNK